MNERILLIGYNDGVLTALDAASPAGSVVVLEEPDLWEGKNLAAKAARHPCLGEVRFGQYQQDEQFMSALSDLRDVRCVAPGLEYAVPAAAQCAEAFGLAGAGREAASLLRDKLALREATAAAGMAAPEFREITSAADIDEFARGRACVVKPANRQASLGVVLLEAGGDTERAWRECSQADEGNQLARRPMCWRYLVEERLRGPEYSTECLVSRGEVVFLNVTAKHTAPGPWPVELGHAVPAADGDLATWRAVCTELVSAVGFDTGIVHAEWVRTTDGPVLIECAGRPPGDKIIDLIDFAYGVNLTECWLALLAGEEVSLPTAAQRGAAIRFITAAPGVIASIEGVDAAQNRPGVTKVDIARSAGDSIGALRSSWDRIGSVIAVGDTPQEAEQFASAASELISVRTE